MFFCRYCGKTLPEDTLFCDGCGKKVTPETGGKTCAEKRESTVSAASAATANGENSSQKNADAGTIRCIRCGTSASAGELRCGVCRSPLLSQDEYEEKLRIYKKVHEINRKYKPAGIIFAFLFIFLIGLLIYFLIPDSARETEVLGFSEAGDLILGFFSFASFMVLIAAAIGRSSRIKKSAIDPMKYVIAAKEFRHLHPLVKADCGILKIYPVMNSSAAGTSQEKLGKVSKAGGRVLAVTMVIMLSLVGWMGYNYFTKYGGLGSGGENLDGTRWEATSGGDFDPAIVFKNGKAYFGYICFSDSDIINDVAGVRQKSDRNGVSYTLTSNSITFKSNNGTSNTYKRDSNTIYFGPATMKKIQ